MTKSLALALFLNSSAILFIGLAAAGIATGRAFDRFRYWDRAKNPGWYWWMVTGYGLIGTAALSAGLIVAFSNP